MFTKTEKKLFLNIKLFGKELFIGMEWKTSQKYKIYLLFREIRIRSF